MNEESKFVWRATHTDGSILEQVNSDGTKSSYEDIARGMLCLFELIDRNTREIKVKIEFSPEQKLIWRRREYLRPGAGMIERVHLVGKQQTKNSVNFQQIFCVFESDGHIEVVDRFKENHPFFDNVVLLPCEEDQNNGTQTT